jgi:N6-L-threonylcarbamoyladenine synthase
MRLRPTLLQSASLVRTPTRLQWRTHRPLMTLAIETSCDDTSVAVLEKNIVDNKTVAQLHFHKKVTSNNAAFKGVHPLVSLQSHQESLASLVNEAIRHLPRKTCGQDAARNEHDTDVVDISQRRLPDVISVTRGPGMRANLFTGLDTAKGLAAAWQVLDLSLHLLPTAKPSTRNRWSASITCKLTRSLHAWSTLSSPPPQLP